jgi:hypothetical protein
VSTGRGGIPWLVARRRGKVLGLIRNARFKGAGFLQRRQSELHYSNPD